MTKRYGFRATLNLAEAVDINACWDNLGIDRRDLSVLVGTSAAGVQAADYRNCKGLTAPLETQITTLAALPGPLITTLGTKIRRTGDTSITSLSAGIVNNDRAYGSAAFGIFSASTSSFFSPLSGSDYTNGGQYRLGTAFFPSGASASTLNYAGSTLPWDGYYVRHRSYFQITDGSSTVRYLPLYVAPPSAIASNVLWLDSEYSQFTTSSDTVSTWVDVLGRAGATQSIAANRPQYLATELGSKPGIVFNGTSSSLSLGTLGSALPNAATLIVVFSLSNAATTGDTSYSILSSGTGSWTGSWGLFSNSLLPNFPPRPHVNGTHIVSIRASSTYGLEFRRNGVREAWSSITYNSGGTYTLGGPTFLAGTIHALALYSDVLDDQMLGAQEEYFRWRYGFTAPDPDAPVFSFTQVMHDEQLNILRLEDNSFLEIG